MTMLKKYSPIEFQECYKCMIIIVIYFCSTCTLFCTAFGNLRTLLQLWIMLIFNHYPKHTMKFTVAQARKPTILLPKSCRLCSLTSRNKSTPSTLSTTLTRWNKYDFCCVFIILQKSYGRWTSYKRLINSSIWFLSISLSNSKLYRYCFQPSYVCDQLDEKY